MIRLSHKNSSNIRLYMMIFFTLLSSVKKDQTWKKSSLTYPTIIDSNIYIYIHNIFCCYIVQVLQELPNKIISTVGSPVGKRRNSAVLPMPSSSRATRIVTKPWYLQQEGRGTWRGHHGSPWVTWKGWRQVRETNAEILDVIYIYICICNIIVCIIYIYVYTNILHYITQLKL